MTEPSEYPAIPTTADELLIAALRLVNDTSMTLNRIDWETARLLGDEADDPKFDHLHDLLRRRFGVESGVFLFIAANNMRLTLPPDLSGDEKWEAANG